MDTETDLFAHELPPKELGLLERAIDALRKTTGLAARLVRGPAIDGTERAARAVVEIPFDGDTMLYQVEIRRIDRETALGALKERFARTHQRWLLVAPRITPEIATRCRELEIPFLDAAGNTFLRRPGMFVFVHGRLPAPDQTPYETIQRAATPTTLRVIFAVLCQPQLLNAPY